MCQERIISTKVELSKTRRVLAIPNLSNTKSIPVNKLKTNNYTQQILHLGILHFDFEECVYSIKKTTIRIMMMMNPLLVVESELLRFSDQLYEALLLASIPSENSF